MTLNLVSHTCDIRVLWTHTQYNDDNCIVCGTYVIRWWWLASFDGIVCDAIMQYSMNAHQVRHCVEDYVMYTYTTSHNAKMSLCTIFVVQNQHETSHTTHIFSFEATPFCMQYQFALSFSRHDYLLDHNNTILHVSRGCMTLFVFCVVCLLHWCTHVDGELGVLFTPSLHAHA